MPVPKNFPTANAVRLAREAIPREPTFDIQAKKPTDHVNVEIKKDAAAEQSDRPPTKSFTYKKTKQADLEMVVHYPPGWKDTDKRPGIVFFFGGGWTNGTIKQFEPQASLPCQPRHGGGTGRLPGEVPARRHAQGMRRGRQECRSLAAAERRQARRRSRPDRGRWRFGGRPHRCLHGLDAGTWTPRGRHCHLLEAQCPGPVQSRAAIHGFPR